MVLLSKKQDRRGFKLVGASLPVKVHHYITLYTLAKGCSKTKIMKTLLEDWISQKDTEQELIAKIIQKVNLQWRVIKTGNKPIPFQEFQETMRLELVAKDLPEKCVNSIMFEIQE